MKDYHVFKVNVYDLDIQVILFVLLRRATIFCIFYVEHDSVVYKNKFVVTLNVKVRKKFYLHWFYSDKIGLKFW